MHADGFQPLSSPNYQDIGKAIETLAIAWLFMFANMSLTCISGNKNSPPNMKILRRITITIEKNFTVKGININEPVINLKFRERSCFPLCKGISFHRKYRKSIVFTMTVEVANSSVTLFWWHRIQLCIDWSRSNPSANVRNGEEKWLDAFNNLFHANLLSAV